MWVFPAEPEVQQLAACYLVSYRADFGREGSEEGQNDDWIPERVHSLWSEHKKTTGHFISYLFL